MRYDDDCFKSQTLKATATNMATQIQFLNRRKRGSVRIDTVMSRGSSGCSLASAVLALSDIPLSHIYVRKPHEKSHGNSEYAGSIGDNKKAIIVDDVVSTGDTVKAVLDQAFRMGIKVVAILTGGCRCASDTLRQECDLPVYPCGIGSVLVERSGDGKLQ